MKKVREYPGRHEDGKPWWLNEAIEAMGLTGVASDACRSEVGGTLAFATDSKKNLFMLRRSVFVGFGERRFSPIDVFLLDSEEEAAEEIGGDGKIWVMGRKGERIPLTADVRNGVID